MHRLNRKRVNCGLKLAKGKRSQRLEQKWMKQTTKGSLKLICIFEHKVDKPLARLKQKEKEFK